MSLRAKILLFYILLQKYNNISKHTRKSGESFRKSYLEVLGEAGIIYWLASELKFKVTLLHIAQLLQLLSLMSLQFLYPFRHLGRRALYNYCFIYMYHKPKFYISGQNYQVLFLSSHHRISFEIYTTPEAASILQCQFLFPHFLNFLQRKLGGR